MIGLGPMCSVRGPGARFGAQVLGSGARAWFGAQVLNSGPRCSIRGPGARFGAQVLGSGPMCSVQGPGARFRAQVLSLGPEPSPKVGPAKVCLLGTEFQKSPMEEEEKEELTTLY